MAEKNKTKINNSFFSSDVITKLFSFSIVTLTVTLGAVYFVLSFTLKPFIEEIRILRDKAVYQEMRITSIEQTIEELPNLLHNPLEVSEEEVDELKEKIVVVMDSIKRVNYEKR